MTEVGSNVSAMSPMAWYVSMEYHQKCVSHRERNFVEGLTGHRVANLLPPTQKGQVRATTVIMNNVAPSSSLAADHEPMVWDTMNANSIVNLENWPSLPQANSFDLSEFTFPDASPNDS